jgi:hypothetical protein
VNVQSNVIIVKKSRITEPYNMIYPSVCGRCVKEGHGHNDCMETVLKCVPCGGPHESFSQTAENCTPPDMSRMFRVIQLNVRKQGTVLDGLMNDEGIKDATVVAFQEPQARRIQGHLITTTMNHSKWTKMIPSTWREERHNSSDDKAPGSYGPNSVGLRTRR